MRRLSKLFLNSKGVTHGLSFETRSSNAPQDEVAGYIKVLPHGEEAAASGRLEP